jgi:pyruvate/2-oxoglutarate dehydrogenase complex dihydrolipoamide dehydrogenase (E3) component
MAQAFACFGTRVTMVSVGGFLSREDPEARALVQRSLADDGVSFELDCVTEKVEYGEGPEGGFTLHLTRGGESSTVTATHLLVAVGRTPNVQGLGLEQAGVAFSASGGVTVDDSMRTSNNSIFAVGDVASAYKFTHVAGTMGTR